MDKITGLQASVEKASREAKAAIRASVEALAVNTAMSASENKGSRMNLKEKL